MEKDKKYNIVLGIMIFLFILLVGIAIACGLGVIGLKDNSILTDNEKESSEIESNDDVINNEVTTNQNETKYEDEKNTIINIKNTQNPDLLNLDVSKCLNKGNADIYSYVGSDEFGIYLYTYDNKINIRISSGSLLEGRDIKVEFDKNYEVTNIDVNETSQVFVIGCGQGIDFPIAFFLMKDGSVEWLNINDALTKKDFNAEGKIPNVQDIKTIINAGAIGIVDKETGAGPGWVTIIGVKEDGSFYDLVPLIVEK